MFTDMAILVESQVNMRIFYLLGHLQKHNIVIDTSKDVDPLESSSLM